MSIIFSSGPSIQPPGGPFRRQQLFINQISQRPGFRFDDVPPDVFVGLPDKTKRRLLIKEIRRLRKVNRVPTRGLDQVLVGARDLPTGTDTQQDMAIRKMQGLLGRLRMVELRARLKPWKGFE